MLLSQIWFRSDYLMLIRTITSINKPEFSRISDIVALSTLFIFCVFSFIPKKFNGPADLLAKATLCN
ncbi:hypothetical protein YC2023_005930 [Brassica napus]